MLITTQQQGPCSAFFLQVVNPGDDKYRRLRLGNPKIAATIAEVPGALDALLAMGWERDANDADFLVCPKGVRVTMAEVRAPRTLHLPFLAVSDLPGHLCGRHGAHRRRLHHGRDAPEQKVS